MTTSNFDAFDHDSPMRRTFELGREAADLIDAYVTMLVKDGCIDEAIAYGQNNLLSPDEALTLAKALQEHDRPQITLEVARHGLNLTGSGKAELAEWLRNRASSMGELEVASHPTTTVDQHSVRHHRSTRAAAISAGWSRSCGTVRDISIREGEITLSNYTS